MVGISIKRFSRIAAVVFTVLVGTGIFVGCTTTNTLPVADAGAAPTTFGGYPATLDGSASSDADGNELTYAWSLVARPEGSQVALSGANTVNPTFVPDVLGEFVFSLSVNDGESSSLPVELTVLARPWFTDITEEAGVGGTANMKWIVRDFATRPRITGQQRVGSSWGDYDADGDYDLYVISFTGNMLYRNNGDGTFTDVAKELGVNVKGGRVGGAVWGDYDGDGNLDLYLPQRAASQAYLFRNSGDGTFTDVAEDAGLRAGNIKRAAGAAWGDYDADGNLDLAVAQKWGREILYRNNGDGTFTDVAPELKVGQELWTRAEIVERLGQGITDRSGSTFQPFWFDYNNDNRLDLFFVVDWSTNYLYKNNGDGTFTDVAEEAGIFMYGNGMGVDAGDYDRDGDLDVYVTNFGTERWAGVGTYMTPNFFFRNNGDGTFSEVSAATGTRGRSGVGWGVNFFDYDNDGYIDLASSYGMIRTSSRWVREARQINLLERNNGDGTFTDLTEISGLGLTCQSMGLSSADYDDDGDLDIFANCGDDRNFLLRNDLANYLDNNWIKIKLEGTESNSFGVGAVVKVTSGGATQMEQLFAGVSTYSQDAGELHFGLAGEQVIEKIEVRWPSDIIQVIENVEANQTITITEPAESATP